MASLSITFKPHSPFSRLLQERRLKHNPKAFLTYSPKTNSNINLTLSRREIPQAKQPLERAIEVEEEEEENHERVIPFSDVVVVKKKRPFWVRRWNYWDVTRAASILGVHLLSLLAPIHFNFSALWIAAFLTVVAAFGFTVSYHRNLAHKSFSLPKWLEYSFALCGTLTAQGDPIEWVSIHRYHHQHADKQRDPHSPKHGYWFSYIGWVFDTDLITQKCGGHENAADLVKQPFYRFLQRTWMLNHLALGVLLYLFGGMPFLVWGMGVRSVVIYHVTFLTNSGCHIWGKRAWKTQDSSKNIWWLAIPTLGDSWHNNHHAFEFSARHGLEWWQLDIAWYFIRFLEALGLATNVKLPTEAQKQRMALLDHV